MIIILLYSLSSPRYIVARQPLLIDLPCLIVSGHLKVVHLLYFSTLRTLRTSPLFHVLRASRNLVHECTRSEVLIESSVGVFVLLGLWGVQVLPHHLLIII